MRRMLAVGAVVLMCLVGTACQPTEPAMTISAKGAMGVGCDAAQIEGLVSPKNATKRVVLQRTVNGQWQDFKWYTDHDTGGTRELIVSPLDGSGGYWIQLQRTYFSQKLAGTLHFRVRSDGSSAFSKSVYLTFPASGC